MSFGTVIFIIVFLSVTLAWHRVAGVIGAIVCFCSVWYFSEGLIGPEDETGGYIGVSLFIGFIGLIYIVRYVVGRDDFDDSIHEEGATLNLTTGQIFKNYSSGTDRVVKSVIGGGMVLIIIAGTLLGYLRY